MTLYNVKHVEKHHPIIHRQNHIFRYYLPKYCSTSIK
jgi:hypothetical protein